MLLSIVIPTYNRSREVLHSLSILREQIQAVESGVEVIVCDDASTDDTEEVLTRLESETGFFRYVRYPSNIGLEKNLIECSLQASGEYLWIFGDDDFLATPDALATVLAELASNHYDLLVLNRMRQNFALDKTISDDWMGISGEQNRSYPGLRKFFLEWGFISVIGFVTVNVMRRQPFLDAYDERYFGTMYPQLGMMANAFSDAAVLLMSKPLICHRTQTAEEKALAFAKKAEEKTFMSDVGRRDATYFGAPYVRMLSLLIDRGSLTYQEINQINENTVINGRLIDFLFNNIVKAVNYGLVISAVDQEFLNSFFTNVILDPQQVHRLSRYNFMTDGKFLPPDPDRQELTISVVTPSFNQAQFFPECLDSVFDQSYSPVEHIVLDPGSDDGSRNIARYYRHVTLVEEPDEGQGDAVGKGINRASGDIIAWLNSDDSYYDNEVFETISALFAEGEDQVIYGDGIFLDGEGKKIRDVYVNKDPSTLPWRFQMEDGIFQPALFFRRSVSEAIGLPSKFLEYCMDYEFWIRAVKSGIQFRYVAMPFAKAYFHTDNKTLGQRGKSYEQVCSMMFDQFGYVNHVWLQRYAEFLSHGLDGVIAHRGNTEFGDSEEYEAIYDSLLRRFNTNAITVEMLASKSSQRGFGDTYRVLGERDLLPSHYHEVDDIQKGATVRANYAMGGKVWSFDRPWKNAQIKKSHDFLQKMIDGRKSDTCVIVCNGPSLNQIDKQLLSRVDVIACNGIFLDEEIAANIDFFTCVNYLVAEQYAPQINALRAFKVFPWWLAYCINESDNTFFVDAMGFPEFSTDIFKNMSWRHTVTFFNMHLAYGLGYKKALLVGCDHSYVQPDTVSEEELIFDEGDDLNHFDPRYFKSKKWQAADTDQMEAMYKLAKDAFEADGREIINCTVGGHLELFRRSPLGEQLASDRQPKLSQIGREALLGPFDRSEKIHIDETHIVAKYLGSKKIGCMVDVGAHHGWGLQPFLELGWGILAFEPDPKNRAILEGRVGDRAEVEIVAKACSDKAEQFVPFYASGESTGISGLSRFRDSHEVICQIETTSLETELEARDIGKIDFLKIDAEGFELMVLKGFPWESQSPDVILCEFENFKTVPLGYRFEELADFLFQKNYAVFISEWHPVLRYGVQHDWKSLTPYFGQRLPDDSRGKLIAFKIRPDEEALVNAAHSVVSSITVSGESPVIADEPQDVEGVPPEVTIKTYTVVERFASVVSQVMKKYPKMYPFFAKLWRLYLSKRHGL